MRPVKMWILLSLLLLTFSLSSCATNQPKPDGSLTVTLPSKDYVVVNKNTLAELMEAAATCKFEPMLCLEDKKNCKN